MTTAQLSRATGRTGSGQVAEPRLVDEPSVRLGLAGFALNEYGEQRVAPADLALLGLSVLACLAASAVRSR